MYKYTVDEFIDFAVLHRAIRLEFKRNSIDSIGHHISLSCFLILKAMGNATFMNGEIATMGVTSQQAAGKHINTLIKAGLVELVTRDEDKRIKRVQASKEGRAAVKKGVAMLKRALK